METSTDNLKHEVRGYFLYQGQRINQLHEILNSNLFAYHLWKWFSMLIETILYVVFAVIIIKIAVMPTDANHYISNTGNANSEDFTLMMQWIKVFLLLLSLPLLAFTILLGHNRKKNTLIREAFTEVNEMKEGFDKAVEELEL
ncbi:MAG: hypothetical protein JWP12_3318 [Bacteroidetes bacterium]|nr:hypothetical protein [Bacteroidota bacterium]